MPRMKLILNVAADHGHARDKGRVLRQLVEQQVRQATLDGETYEISWVETQAPRHAVDLAAQAAQDGYDIVVAAGGDGTVHETINGLMQIEADRRPRLGILPIGSGNDFARNVGIPDRIEQAIGSLFLNTTRTVDVASVADGNGRQEHWNNTLGLGFNGAVNIATRSKKRWRGFLLYFVSVLETILFKPLALNVQVQIDDGPPITQPVSMISICNGPREGGGFPVVPSAVVDDGLLSYMTMRSMSRVQMLFFLPVVMSAAHVRFPRFFQGGTARRIQVESDKGMAVHADGEVFGPWEADVRRIEAHIIPAAVQVLCPNSQSA